MGDVYFFPKMDAFLRGGSPKLRCMELVKGKIEKIENMEDDRGYPHDSGNLHVCIVKEKMGDHLSLGLSIKRTKISPKCFF